MKLQFSNRRAPSNVDELSPLQIRQLEHAGTLYHGDSYSAAHLIGPVSQEDEETSFDGFLTLWDVLDADGNLLYEAWFYMVDSGTIYKAGTMEVVAEVIQGYAECDEEMEKALVAARKEVRKENAEWGRDISL